MSQPTPKSVFVWDEAEGVPDTVFDLAPVWANKLVLHLGPPLNALMPEPDHVVDAKEYE